MRISDWSSDVCSSDLTLLAVTSGTLPGPAGTLDHRTDVGCKARIGEDKSFDPVRGKTRGHRHCEKVDLFFGAGADQMRAQDRSSPLFDQDPIRSEEHTSELQSLMRISYAVFFLKNKKTH